MFGPSKKYCEPKVTYTIVTPSTVDPITVEQVTQFMQIDFPDFNEIIADIFIKAVIPEAEKYTGLALGKKTIQLAGDWQDKNVYMPFEPILSTSNTGLQEVGYTVETLPGDIRLALLNMIHIAFENRTTGLNYTTGLKLLDRSRRRVGL